MKHTAQEVKSALFVISDFCTEQTSCKECPFGGIDMFDQSIPCLLKTSAPNEFFPFAMSIPAADFSKKSEKPMQTVKCANRVDFSEKQEKSIT